MTQQLSGNLSNNKESLSLAAVIHASWIKKAVEMLPEPVATETAK